MTLLNRLKNHPFAVDAHFDFSLVLTYALPSTVLAPLVPPTLALDTFDARRAHAHHDLAQDPGTTDHGAPGPVGFVAVAMVQTRGLRPARLPRLFGRSFFLVGTRIFVRFTTGDGRTLRGLYILRSQTDSRAMHWLGDVFTRYRYELLTVDVKRSPGHIAVHAGDLAVDVDSVATPERDGAPALPPGSPFSTWKDARRFAGPMPHTFSMLDDGHVLVVEGVRQNWKPRPVRVVEARVPFFAERGLSRPVLASAFVIEDVPYHWNAGRREPCPAR